jgi:hypothetical protein
MPARSAPRPLAAISIARRRGWSARLQEHDRAGLQHVGPRRNPAHQHRISAQVTAAARRQRCRASRSLRPRRPGKRRFQGAMTARPTHATATAAAPEGEPLLRMARAMGSTRTGVRRSPGGVDAVSAWCRRTGNPMKPRSRRIRRHRGAACRLSMRKPPGSKRRGQGCEAQDLARGEEREGESPPGRTLLPHTCPPDGGGGGPARGREAMISCRRFYRSCRAGEALFLLRPDRVYCRRYLPAARRTSVMTEQKSGGERNPVIFSGIQRRET